MRPLILFFWLSSSVALARAPVAIGHRELVEVVEEGQRRAVQTAQRLAGAGEHCLRGGAGAAKCSAQRHRSDTIANVKSALNSMLSELSKKKPATLRKERRKKFLDIGQTGL